jgi:hypothetical protein
MRSGRVSSEPAVFGREPMNAFVVDLTNKPGEVARLADAFEMF